ncbi:MAG TPA: hypothetical protein VFX96_20255, partial [Pyrinomonadaceae bacterium]|nr:hypothetical protein [Pyrinomonadaceae bacterium]
MRLKLYCNRYAHFKDALVCSVSCVYRTRCRDFALFYDEHRADVDALVADYYDERRDAPAAESTEHAGAAAQALAASGRARTTGAAAIIRLEVLRVMAEAFFIWIDKEDRAELVETPEVLRRAERGQKPKHIYKVSQEMELRYQLVPRKSIEKAKRAAAAADERTAARRRARTPKTPTNAPVPFPAPVAPAEPPAQTP